MLGIDKKNYGMYSNMYALISLPFEHNGYIAKNGWVITFFRKLWEVITYSWLDIR